LFRFENIHTCLPFPLSDDGDLMMIPAPAEYTDPLVAVTNTTMHTNKDNTVPDNVARDIFLQDESLQQEENINNTGNLKH
jgi:hypothetical protein